MRLKKKAGITLLQSLDSGACGDYKDLDVVVRSDVLDCGETEKLEVKTSGKVQLLATYKGDNKALYTSIHVMIIYEMT